MGPRGAGRALLSAAVAVLLLAGCSDGSGTAGAPAAEPGPLAGARLHVNPASHAAEQVASWRAQGRVDDAAVLQRIAGQPTAVWFAGQQADPGGSAAALVQAAAAADAVPVLVLYNLPGRDCGQFSAGGAADADAYRAWVGAVAAGLGDARAVVVLEPDAVPHLIEGCEQVPVDRATRLQLLNAAVDTLARHPGVRTYLDAGNASWVGDRSALADQLSAAGIARTAGFSLNVANFETTAASTAYGHGLSDLLGGAHFVVDTGRNGNGPGDTWCNPPGRALGTPPTTDTGDGRVDAHLWVKQPGDSDGACGQGQPAAGVWWPEYALSLARSAPVVSPPPAG
ncbi:glycoside hydrolase family 6 protein [Kineococcus rubinsiae]|uniref:glycoside hydrolase family 6 protein n=1 Tax=Kineococcus rubinsiae TaxID=2609562 RepID=UPI001431FEAC|nr:glycoside hydrolase family 6 protein [Kineococcus rubinsiae]NIZ91682.1 glycoside hydrolase family 6 protein [Kineococcus rubinsiae]